MKEKKTARTKKENQLKNVEVNERKNRKFAMEFFMINGI